MTDCRGCTGTCCTGVGSDPCTCPIDDEELTPEQDMQDRWRPTETAVNHAVALLKAEPRADFALVPLVQPGKEYGWWEIGQKVETVPGVVILSVNSFKAGADIPSHSWARNATSQVAKRVLGDAPGTVSYASISRDGTWAVFEDIL